MIWKNKTNLNFYLAVHININPIPLSPKYLSKIPSYCVLREYPDSLCDAKSCAAFVDSIGCGAMVVFVEEADEESQWSFLRIYRSWFILILFCYSFFSLNNSFHWNNSPPGSTLSFPCCGLNFWTHTHIHIHSI